MKQILILLTLLNFGYNRSIGPTTIKLSNGENPKVVYSESDLIGSWKIVQIADTTGQVLMDSLTSPIDIYTFYENKSVELTQDVAGHKYYDSGTFRVYDNWLIIELKETEGTKAKILSIEDDTMNSRVKTNSTFIITHKRIQKTPAFK